MFLFSCLGKRKVQHENLPKYSLVDDSDDSNHLSNDNNKDKVKLPQSLLDYATRDYIIKEAMDECFNVITVNLKKTDWTIEQCNDTCSRFIFHFCIML
jgi:hypothetical protein